VVEALIEVVIIIEDHTLVNLDQITLCDALISGKFTLSHPRNGNVYLSLGDSMMVGGK
jgi:DNA-directed RNA polymerase subunit L